MREVNLTTGKTGLQFSLGGNGGVYQNPPKPLALAALPGSPNSVVVATQTPFTYQGTVAIFDRGILRGTATNSTVNAIFYALLTNGTRSEIYAGGGGYQTYTYSASGLMPLATGPSGFTYASYPGNEMQIAGGTLYTDYGQAFDAESGNLLGTFYVTGTTPAQGPTFADTTLGMAFILDNSASNIYGSYNQIQTFNLSNYTSTGNAIPVSVTQGSSGPSHLTRWGTNGLAFRTSLGVFSVRSNLVKDLSNVNADLSAALIASGGTTTGNNTTYTATVTNNGPSASTNIALTATLPVYGCSSFGNAFCGHVFDRFDHLLRHWGACEGCRIHGCLRGSGDKRRNREHERTGVGLGKRSEREQQHGISICGGNRLGVQPCAYVERNQPGGD